MGRVEGRTAIVTGGASGLGAATARLLAEEGARVLVTDIQEEAGRQVASDCGGVFLRHDTAVEDDWVQAFQTARSELGPVSILFNNAGVRPKTVPLEETTLDDWKAHMAVNIDGVFLGIKHAIRAMKEDGGAIVSTSSIYGIVGAAMIGAYSASKGGVRTLTKAAAMECTHLGYPIRVNSIHPGFIETGMLESVKQEFGASMIEKRMIGDTPMKRIGEARDIAEGVLYLVADSGKFITGIELPIDGGYMAR
jgi:NAD(P)-dependent dehydrogenase (short-subunit alcohol dehydrogenase family)